MEQDKTRRSGRHTRTHANEVERGSASSVPLRSRQQRSLELDVTRRAVEETPLSPSASLPAADPDEATRASIPPATPAQAEVGQLAVVPRLARGDMVGRYIVLDLLGAGAMGAVYRAYDPELDRRVALKLLLPWDPAGESTQAARTRLQREAQAMAQLAHPNVISVYDVGLHDGEVFFAMELVDGIDLSKWLHGDSGKPNGKVRPWREVVEVFLQAGRGLAAAHDVQVVHRDFKPSNVLVGDDGRVRVLDFGIARARQDAPGDERSVDATATFRRSTLDETVTEAGMVMGTPAYMAPEQHRGDVVDARVDQYAFCVALYEGLYGERPFSGRDFRELAVAKKGPVRSAPDGTRVPSRIRKVVVRGLQLEPDRRFETMHALLHELDVAAAARRRRALTGAFLALALVGGGAFAGAVMLDRSVCSGAEERIHGVWNDRRRDQLATAFARVDVPYAKAAWEATSVALDDYARAWVRSYTEACEATHVRGEQSDSRLDARMQCLQSRLQELSSLVEVLAEADPEIVERSVVATHALGDVSDCLGSDDLLLQVEAPTDMRVRMEVAELRGTIERARKFRDAGKYDRAIEIVAEVRERAENVGYGPLLADVLLLHGLLLDSIGDVRGAEQTLYHAAWTATENRYLRVQAEAWIALVRVVGDVQARFEDGQWLARQAQATLSAAGGADRLTAELLANHARVLHHEGRYDQALAKHDQALALRIETLGEDHPDVAIAHNDVGVVQRNLGRYEEALEHHRRALEIQEYALGKSHPDRVTTLLDIGSVLFAQGKTDEAGNHFKRASDIVDATLAPDHPLRASVLTNLAAVAYRLRDTATAEDLYRSALALRERALGPNHPDVGASLANLALVLASRGHHDEALGLYQRGLDIKRATLGPRHPQMPKSLANVAASLLALGRANEALSHWSEALEIIEETKGADHLDAAGPLVGMGKAYADLGQRDAGIDVLSRALVLLDDENGNRATLAEAHFLVAKLLDKGHRRDEARAHGEAARVIYDAMGVPAVSHRSAVDDWLAQRKRG